MSRGSPTGYFGTLIERSSAPSKGYFGRLIEQMPPDDPFDFGPYGHDPMQTPTALAFPQQTGATPQPAFVKPPTPTNLQSYGLGEEFGRALKRSAIRTLAAPVEFARSATAFLKQPTVPIPTPIGGTFPLPTSQFDRDVAERVQRGIGVFDGVRAIAESTIQASERAADGSYIMADGGINWNALVSEGTENAANLVTTLAATLAGGLAAGPVGAVTAGTTVGAGLDTASVIEEVRRASIARGDDPDTAARLAGVVGAMYAPVFAVLERIPVARFTGMATDRVIGQALTRRLVAAGIKGAAAEVPTEVLQGTAEDVLHAIVARDPSVLDGFFGRRAKEVFWGGILGGGAGVAAGGTGQTFGKARKAAASMTDQQVFQGIQEVSKIVQTGKMADGSPLTNREVGIAEITLNILNDEASIRQNPPETLAPEPGDSTNAVLRLSQEEIVQEAGIQDQSAAVEEEAPAVGGTIPPDAGPAAPTPAAAPTVDDGGDRAGGGDVSPDEGGRGVPSPTFGRPGRAAQIQTRQGPISATYVAAEASDIIPSHDARKSFQQNPRGDKNERPYHDPVEGRASRQMVKNIAEKPDPSQLLTDTPSPLDGPPIVSSEGVVYGGNARSMAMQLIYARGGENAQKLRDAVIEAGAKFGITGLDQMKQPIIVRATNEQFESGELSRILNESSSAARTTATDAVSRASKVSQGTADKIGRMLNPPGVDEPPSLREVLADPDHANDIARAFVKDGVWTDADITRFMDGRTGQLNEEGKLTIERTLLGRLIDDPSTLGAMTPGVRQKVMAALPNLIRATESEHGAVVKDALFKAVAVFGEYKNSELPLRDFFFNQATMAPPPGFGDPAVAALVHALDAKGQRAFKEGGQALADKLGVADAGEARFGFAVEEVETDPTKAIIDSFAPGGIVPSKAIQPPVAEVLSAETTPPPDDGPPLFAMGAAAAPELGRGPTSIKNAVVDFERERRGLPPAMQAAKRSFGEVWDQAMREIEVNPIRQATLIADLAANPRAVTDLEDALLLHRQITLQNEYDQVLFSLEAARQRGDVQAEADQMTLESIKSNELLQLYDVNKNVGTETGRGLNARKMMANADYSLVRMLYQKEKAVGRPLTADERGEVAGQQKKIVETRTKLDQKAEEIESNQATDAFDAFMADVQEAQKEQTLAALNQGGGAALPTAADTAAKRKRITDRLDGEDFGDVNISNAAQALAKLFVAEGIVEREALIDAVHTELSAIFPDITRRQTMDAISGYGQFRPLSQDAIDVQLRDLKGQMQQVAKLEDIQAKRPLMKTGVERRSPSDEERRLQQQVNEAKRRFGVVVTDPARQLKSAQDAIKTRLKHSISDLEYQIQTGQRIVKGKSEVIPDDEIKTLTQRRDQLRKEFELVFGKRELTDAQRVKLAMESVQRSINELQERIAGTKPLFGKKESKTPSTPELEAIRAQRDALQQQLKEMQELVQPKKTPEQRSLDALKSRLLSRMEDMHRRIIEGNFTPKPKKELVLDKEARKLKHEHEKAKRDYHIALEKDRRKNRHPVSKVFGVLPETANVMRAILTSFDFSAVLRQGGFIAFAHPIRAIKAMPDMFRAFFGSEQTQFEVFQNIENRTNSQSGLYKRAGLQLTSFDGKLSAMEEAYMSRWAQYIPGVNRSEKAYIAFLNRLRADSFDAMTATLGKRGTISDPEAKLIANFVNVATGRGDLGMASAAAVPLATVFFSPRYVVSRFQLLNLQPLRKGVLTKGQYITQTKRVRAQIALEYARTLIGLGIMYALWTSLGGEVEDDPLSSDFGKFRIGDTRIDPLFGLAQATTLMSRLAAGEKKTISGDIVPIRGEDVPYGAQTADDVIKQFLRTKLAPVTGSAVDLIVGKDVLGRPVTLGSEAQELIIPMAYRDIYDTMRKQGIPKGTALGLLSIFGMGVQNYDDEKRGERTARQR